MGNSAVAEKKSHAEAKADAKAEQPDVVAAALASAPTPCWAFGDPPRASGNQPNLVFGMEPNGVQANASGTFRRRLDAPPPPVPADRTAGLLQAFRENPDLVEVGAAPALAADRAKLLELIALCGKRAADVQKAHADPALLEAADFSERVRQLTAEAETIAARRQEAETALARADAAIKGLRDIATIHLRAAVQKSLRVEAEILERHRMEVMAEVGKAVSPLLEQLYKLDRTEKIPPNVETVVATLLEERFAPAP